AAPLAGKLADRRGPALVTRIGAALTAVSFATMFALPSLSPEAGLVLLAGAALGFDLGVQVTLIAHQSIVYGLDPAARSRLNAVLMVSMFIGMAGGAALGSLALTHAGWLGVTALAMVAALGALTLRLLPQRGA
ncbi:MAG: MFS transporter, partial [Bordetella sp.]|nr:MFS transporter [Bordetella sp.]